MACAAFDARPAAGGVDLFLFAGQSNMAGRGIVTAAHPAPAPALTQGAAYEYRAVTDPTRLYPLAEPFGENENRAGGIFEPGMKTGGMVTAFCNACFARTGVPIVGVSAAKGGSALAEWQAGGAFLTDALRRFADARQYLGAAGIPVRRTALVWCQGETDGDNGTPPAEYLRLFRAFRAATRAAGLETCFLVRIGQCNIPGAFDRYDPLIALQTTFPETETGVVLVSTAFAGMRRRGLMKDAFHYVQAGYNEVGTEAGAAVGEYLSTGHTPHLPEPFVPEATAP